jgi:hypothetical protein
METAPEDDQDLVWCLGAILFGHAVTFFSVAYFDQTILLYYLALGSLGSLEATVTQQSEPAVEVEPAASDTVSGGGEFTQQTC